jgi:4a-hydroxytetrahydrobiopterin dehydratase
MNEKRTTARTFHDAPGVEDWRVLFSGAHAYFRARSFQQGARFVAAIAEVAQAIGHFPDVDLRPEGVTVRTASGEYGALSGRDVELARGISVEARKLAMEPDPSQVQAIGIAVAQPAGTDVGPFWAAQAEARVAAALAAGGRLADASHAPHWWTIASPENHGVDIAAWPDVEDADG